MQDTPTVTTPFRFATLHAQFALLPDPRRSVRAVYKGAREIRISNRSVVRCSISSRRGTLAILLGVFVAMRSMVPVRLGGPMGPQSLLDAKRFLTAWPLSFPGSVRPLADAETFSRVSAGETYRRGTARAGVVCAVMDGATWLQEWVSAHCPDAVRILDFPHAAQHLALAAAGQPLGREVRRHGHGWRRSATRANTRGPRRC